MLDEKLEEALSDGVKDFMWAMLWDWKSLDMELMRIAIEATCLVLDDRFEKLKKEWESEG